jgi:tetratricopeptide (TPR) repeat protein
MILVRSDDAASGMDPHYRRCAPLRSRSIERRPGCLGKDADLIGVLGKPLGEFAVLSRRRLPVRLAIETRDWTSASQLTPMPGSGPQVAAIVWWARALGKLRASKSGSVDADIGELLACREALRTANDTYWMAQTDALLKSAQAWRFAATADDSAAVAAMKAAAEEEDGLEKLPLTPGPIVPAREQLGELYLSLGKPREALDAFNAALTLAPGRLGALRGKAEAARRIVSP